MTDRELDIGVYRYEHTEPLFDGRVAVDGVDATLHTSPLISDVFAQMAQGELDIAEFGLTYFLRTLDLPDPPFLALPIFPNRNFRHSALFVNTDSGIGKPEDLAGRTVGEFALYGSDPGVWMKGVLADEYGVTPGEMDWVIGGTDHPIPAFDWIPQPVPDGVRVRHTEGDETLAALLEAGEIDALLSVDVPQSLLDGSTTKIRRLFVDYETVERDYYRRTGIFPMMHVVAIRREFAQDQALGRGGVPGVRPGQGDRPGALPGHRGEAAHVRDHALVQRAVRGEPRAAGRGLVALRRRRQPLGRRHLPALPPRAGPVAAAAHLGGHLRARSARHLNQPWGRPPVAVGQHGDREAREPRAAGRGRSHGVS
jgi:hypothetical protein